MTVHSFKLLYFFFLSTNLIWFTDSIIQNQNLFQIQNNFERFLCFQCKVSPAPHFDYDNIKRLFTYLLKKNLTNKFKMSLYTIKQHCGLSETNFTTKLYLSFSLFKM